jgi:hypothetical protein
MLLVAGLNSKSERWSTNRSGAGLQPEGRSSVSAQYH